MIREALRRLAYLWNRKRIERELEEEMTEHRRQMVDPRSFGSQLKLREETRDAWGWVWLDRLGQDYRYAWRGLLRSPAYALSSTLILTLALGLNLALFQVIDAAVLRPDAIKDPTTLVRLSRQSKHGSSSGVPYQITEYIRRHNTVFSAVLTQTGNELAWGDNAADLVRVKYVSANLFDELGYGAAEGRVFHEAIDESPDAPPVAVLAHEFWVRRFGGQSPAIGQEIRLNDRPVTVVGVAPPGFSGPRPVPVDVFVLIHQFDHFNQGSDFLTTWTANNTEFYGRMRPGVNLASLPAGLRPLIEELAQERPNDVQPDEALPASPGTRRFFRDREARQLYSFSALAMGLLLVVLLVACANLANLMLARTQHRMAELSVRAAIGAGRTRLVRQLATETLLVTTAGATGGWILCRVILGFVRSIPDVPSSVGFGSGWVVWCAAAVLCLFAVTFAGLLPAWSATRGNLLTSLRASSSSSAARGWLQSTLLAAQVTGGCALLLLSGLWVRGVQRILSDGPGYDYRNVAALDPSLGKYGVKGAQALTFWEETLAGLEGYPEIESMAISSHEPMGRSLSQSGYSDAPGLSVTFFKVQPEFFTLMRIPLLRGRNFEAGDYPRTVVIIGKRLAEKMYGSIDAVGKGFPLTDPKRTVVGVTAEARLVRITATNSSEVYEPLTDEDYGFSTLLIRFKGRPDHILEAARAAARGADSRVLARSSLLTDNLERRMSPYRLLGAVLTGVGVLTMALASVGIFGLVAYSVGRRTKEMGIRRALGARDASLLLTVLRQTAGPVAAGLVLGCIAGGILAHVMSGEPFYLDPTDLTGTVLSVLVLVLVATAACLLPARLALRVDPLEALRQD